MLNFIGAARKRASATGGAPRPARPFGRLAYSAARPRRNRPTSSTRAGEDPRGRFVHQQRKLDGQHDQEGDEHHHPFPRRQTQFSVRAARAQVGGDGADHAHGVKVRQPAHVLDHHHQDRRDDRRHDQAQVGHAEFVEFLKLRRQFAVARHQERNADQSHNGGVDRREQQQAKDDADDPGRQCARPSAPRRRRQTSGPCSAACNRARPDGPGRPHRD